MFTATTVLCNSFKDCLKLKSLNNYPGILKIHRGEIGEFCLFGMLGTLISASLFQLRNWLQNSTSSWLDERKNGSSLQATGRLRGGATHAEGD